LCTVDPWLKKVSTEL